MAINSGPDRICDFCATPSGNMQAFACEDFTLPSYNYKSVGPWYACQICSSLINLGQWDALQTRAIDIFHERHLPGADREKSESFVKALQVAFRQHRT